MNGQPRDPVEEAKAGRPLLSAVDGHKPGESALVVKGADEMVARLDCSTEAKENAGWAKAIANRWNIHHDLVDGLRELARAAQEFSGGRRSPTGALEAGLANARRLLDRAEGQAKKKAKGVERITTEPETMGGKPCIRGTRLAVEHVLGMLAAGDSVTDLLNAYPGLDREDVLACLTFAQRRLEPEPPPVGLELRITMEPGVNPEDVARAAKAVVEQRLEALAAENRMDTEALDGRVAARLRALGSALAVLFRALPQRYQPSDAPSDWEGEFASGAVNVDGLRRIVEWAAARAKAEAAEEAAKVEVLLPRGRIVVTAGARIRCDKGDELLLDTPTCEVFERASTEMAAAERYQAEKSPAEVMPLWCPHCGTPHVDEGEWATRAHVEHLCATCHGTWRLPRPVFGAPQGDTRTRGELITALKAAEASAAHRLKAMLWRDAEAKRPASAPQELIAHGRELWEQALRKDAGQNWITPEAGDELRRLEKDQRERAVKAEKAGEEWQRSFERYRKAWIRELGGEGKIRPKAHEIDALVLATEALRLRAEAGEAGVRAELAELHARKEETAKLRRQVLELEGKLEGAAIRAAGAVQVLGEAGKLAEGVPTEEAVAAVRKAVAADLIGEHVGLLARLQEQAESAREKLLHAQVRAAELEKSLDAQTQEVIRLKHESGEAIRQRDHVSALLDAAKRGEEAARAEALAQNAGLLKSEESKGQALGEVLEAWRGALGKARPGEAKGTPGLVAATKALVEELDSTWKAAGVPIRGMVALAEVVAEIRRGRDELLGMAEAARAFQAPGTTP